MTNANLTQLAGIIEASAKQMEHVACAPNRDVDRCSAKDKKEIMDDINHDAEGAD